ncbi:YbhB/YbcL family Raf kinase inhibitor-like protein [Halosolutus halophilus]|uniref:YbhB/YbcL family Raf kinase inhibitor-like protein n=1 Tax=Halosolutus halophilus TaxID=1552990 RepID=UPI0022351B8A|nr:YbhB/YbcL family Raf kinase inhibitor-like protein [Halosolutus halophilus]
MLTRRDLLGAGVLLVSAGCLGEGTDTGNGDRGTGPSFSSPAFTGGTSIPPKYTCDGEDVSPPLRLRGTPGTESLAVVVDDPDAPTDDPFVHWLLWNVPPDIEDIPEAIAPEPTVEALDGAVQGTNDFGDLGYRGPCPPADDEKHTYQFTVQLVDTILDLDPGTASETFRTTVEPHVRGEATITGTYER